MGALAGVVSATATLAGSVTRYRPRQFDRLTLTISGTDALWVGAFGFRSVRREFRGEDLFGVGGRTFVVPSDLPSHAADTEMYSPIQLLAAPMAGFDPDQPMQATITHRDRELDSGVITDVDDAISLRLE